MVVTGPTFSLRYLTEHDAEALFELAQDPEVTRFFSWGPYRSIAEPRAYIESLGAQRRAGRRIEFGIVDTTGGLIGITGLSEFGHRDRRAILGTWLGREHWGTGANRESKALVLAFGFRSLGLQRISALANPTNARSLVALGRIGFAEEGVLRGWQLHGGQRKDVTMLRLLREDWECGPLAEIAVTIEGDPPAAFTTAG